LKIRAYLLARKCRNFFTLRENPRKSMRFSPLNWLKHRRLFPYTLVYNIYGLGDIVENKAILNKRKTLSKKG
jgi:hypothetical protein